MHSIRSGFGVANRTTMHSWTQKYGRQNMANSQIVFQILTEYLAETLRQLLYVIHSAAVRECAVCLVLTKRAFHGRAQQGLQSSRDHPTWPSCCMVYRNKTSTAVRTKDVSESMCFTLCVQFSLSASGCGNRVTSPTTCVTHRPQWWMSSWAGWMRQ